MPSRRTVLAVTAATAAAGLALSAKSADAGPPTYFVLFHTPGPAWQAGVDFRKQPGVMDHVQYMSGFLDKGLLVMGGPFLDNSGGMMIMRAASLGEAQARAEADPTVKAGLLKVTVKPWLAAMIGQPG